MADWAHVSVDGTVTEKEGGMTLLEEVQWRAGCELKAAPRMDGAALCHRSYRWGGPVLGPQVADYIVFSHKRGLEKRAKRMKR